MRHPPDELTVPAPPSPSYSARRTLCCPVFATSRTPHATIAVAAKFPCATGLPTTQPTNHGTQAVASPCSPASLIIIRSTTNFAVRPNEHPSAYTHVLLHGNPTTDDPPGRRFFSPSSLTNAGDARMHGPRSMQPDDATSRTRPVAFRHDRASALSETDRRVSVRSQTTQMDQERRGGFTDLICRTPQRLFQFVKKKYTGLLAVLGSFQLLPPCVRGGRSLDATGD
jgi:hypothetical protein